MSKSIACQAITDQLCLELSYEGYERIVEVHAVGYTTSGNLAMRVWQVRGGSESGKTSGWKMMILDKAININLTDEKSEAPREGYSPGDRGMSEIICEI